MTSPVNPNWEAFQKLYHAVENRGADRAHKFRNDVYALTPERALNAPTPKDIHEFTQVKSLLTQVHKNEGSQALQGLINDFRMLLFLAQEKTEREETARRRVNVVLAGLPGAGKQSLLYDLIMDVPSSSGEEEDFVVERWVYRDKDFEITNLGGPENHPTNWPPHLSKAHVLIYVVDSSAPASFARAQKHLKLLVGTIERTATPVVIAANKSDLPTAIPTDQLAAKLDLANILSFTKWTVISTRVVKSHDYTRGLLEILALGCDVFDVNQLIAEYAAPMTYLENAFDWFLAHTDRLSIIGPPKK